MYQFLVFLIIALFLGMLFLNVYFRVKVFKVYKVLVQNRVQFGAEHLFNAKKMETDVISKHPEMRTEIETFVSHIRYSMSMATVLVALITLFGAVLMYYR
jgi:hypothetical protein